MWDTENRSHAGRMTQHSQRDTALISESFDLEWAAPRLATFTNFRDLDSP